MKNIINHLKDLLHMQPNQSITRKAFQPLYDVACSGWKTKFDTLLREQQFNEKLVFTHTLIKQMFNAANDDKQKNILENLFTFPKETWQDVKDIKSACAVLGEDDEDVKELRVMQKYNLSLKTINQKELEICIKAVNDGWTPDFSNSSESKHLPYFKKERGEWSVGGVDDYYWDSYFSVGFYYESDEKARHGIKYFMKMYTIWLG
jgi:hypothetical protein